MTQWEDGRAREIDEEKRKEWRAKERRGERKERQGEEKRRRPAMESREEGSRLRECFVRRGSLSLWQA